MNRAVVTGFILVVSVAAVAIAMHHEKDELVALDKEWGEAVQGQAAIEALKRIIDKDIIEMSGGGIATRADMIAEVEAADPATGPYVADKYEVKMITDDVAIMTHHAGDPEPHWSLHVWQKKGGKWVVVASASAPDATD